MRHRVFGRKLNRDVKERKALFKSLIYALITHGRIKTTTSRAKAVIGLVERLVTYAKEGSSSTVRQIASILNKKEAINKLINNISPQFKDKVGGYLRMIKIGRRKGDQAEEVILEWSVPKEKTILVKKDKKEKKNEND